VIVTSASNSSGLPASIEQYRQADIKAPFVGAVGIMLPTVYKMAGDANNGIVSSDIYFSNLPPFTAIPENIAFVEAYKKAHGVEPAKSAALGAAALQVWARAVEQTKSLDRKTVAEAIRGKTITGTLFGDATFLPNGQLKPRFVMFKVVDGKNATLEALQ
jgi:branched-chain amino acid transport system substrate-binding protein